MKEKVYPLDLALKRQEYLQDVKKGQAKYHQFLLQLYRAWLEGRLVLVKEVGNVQTSE